MRSSAGILLFRRRDGLEVLLVHPGGPFWRHRDEGAWQIPKGLIEPHESPEAAARREVSEELGIALVEPLLALGSIRQAGGKRVEAFAAERDFDPDDRRCNLVEMEWPPRREFPGDRCRALVSHLRNEARDAHEPVAADRSPPRRDR